jgi:phage repressor protein C with HTH and peptisase S24 domain
MLRVSGPSMVPTLRHGDVVVARLIRPDVADGGIRMGDVVIARYRSMPERLVVKTVAAVEGDGWLLASDNAAAGGDSSVHGVADVLARVVVRLRAGSRPQLLRRRGGMWHWAARR